MKRKRNIITYFIYLIFKYVIWLIYYPKLTIEGKEYLSETEPTIIVGNHSQIHGPICGELFTPVKSAIWCAAETMNLKEIQPYSYKDFFGKKPKRSQWFYKLLSYFIAPFEYSLVTNANTIPTYHDRRVVTTFKLSIQALEENKSIVIFPECYEPYSDIVNQFQEGFVDVAKLYYRETGKVLSFTPMYLCPKLHKIVYLKPVKYNPNAPIDEEKNRICEYLMDKITEAAKSMPEHIVVPYANVPRNQYKYNTGRPVSKKRMAQPVVDYRNLRLSNVKSDEYKHLLWMLGWVFYFSMYFITENLIPAEVCHPIHCALDDVIPFCEWFVIPYTGWYLLVGGSLIYFGLYDPKNFTNLQKYIIITQVIAMAAYVLYPSRQDLRPEQFPRENIFTSILGFIYAFDTSTGVCPSLHVGYSLGIASTWLREKSASKGMKTFIVVFVLFVCIAVVFVKQHSAVDIFAALPMCAFAEWFVFWRKKPERTE